MGYLLIDVVIILSCHKSFRLHHCIQLLFVIFVRIAESDNEVYEELPPNVDNIGIDNKLYGSTSPQNDRSINNDDDDQIYSQPRP